MPNARNEVAEEQRPVSGAREPVVDTMDVFFTDVEPAAIAMQRSEADGAAKTVAATGTARGSGKGSDDGANGVEAALVDQVTGKAQQPFIGHRKSDDAEHKQRKNR